MSQVVHCKKQKADVYIGRGSRYGNPFPITSERSRSASIAQFREWLLRQPELLRLVRQQLPGKTLGCFCAPEPCHGDTYAEIAMGAWDHLIPAEPILVFGANLAGRHGKGAALDARRAYGAENGVGRGPTGNAYALPTKDAHLRPLPLKDILTEIDAFLAHATATPHLTYRVTRVGCGLAGHADSEAIIRDAFLAAPENVLLPGIWEAARTPGLARVVVAGSREIMDYGLVEARLDFLLQRLGDIEIVSGGARGPDSLGERYAVERGLALRRIPAEWERLGKPGGMIRNQYMSWYGTHLVAFWDGASSGTAGMKKMAANDKLACRTVTAPAHTA